MILFLLALVQLVGGVLITDSDRDFSGIQGGSGWYYRYYDTGVAPNQMTEFFDNWLGTSNPNSWQRTDSWCQIANTVLHPTTGGTTEDCNTPVGYCAPSLLWMNVENRTGLSIQLVASNTAELSSARDGVNLKVLLNGALNETFSTPFTINKTYTPDVLSSIEIILDPKTNCNNDETTYNIRIYQSEPSPSYTPTALPTSSPTPSYTPSSLPTSSPSASSSVTASYTRTTTPTPTRSPITVCSDVYRHLYGTSESVFAGTTFTINHGTDVIHNPPLLNCGRNPTCTDTGTTCVCIYSNGDSSFCNTQRSTKITYSYGTGGLQPAGQDPACYYHFTKQFIPPSATPTISFTSTLTPTMTMTPTQTASQTASPSATGICNDIKNYINGRREFVGADATNYSVFHGRFITSPYLPDLDMLIGVYQGCVESGSSCVCNYEYGFSEGCNGFPRSGYINYTYGPAFQTSFVGSAACAYNFNASYIRPSFSPSPTLTPSTTASVTSTATTTASPTAAATVTPSQTGTFTPTQTGTFTSTQTATASETPTPSQTSTQTATQTGTQSATQTETPTPTQTSTQTETGTPSQTTSATISPTQTTSQTASPTRTATGICNDVRNYVFSRRRDSPTDEYTIYHGINLTHFYYPAHLVLIGSNPVCVDRADECVCTYSGGDTEFCPDERTGIVRYSYDDNYRTYLVSDTDPPCVYRFNTTFFLPYMSPSPTRTVTATATPTYTSSATATPTYTSTSTPRFVPGRVRTLRIPPNFPAIPANASTEVLAGLASGFISTLNTSSDDFTSALSVLASSLAANSNNLTLSVSTPEFTWHMTPVPTEGIAPLTVGNVSAALPPLGPGMVYSFIARTSNDSLPAFSINALGTSNNEFSISGLTTPLTFAISAEPPANQTVECVYWNGTEWDTAGCAFLNGTCACTHFTEFSARFAAIKDANTALFSGAKDVYSLAGFKKYAALYGLLIAIFLAISVAFCGLIALDRRGEDRYRVAVEDIEEVCKVLGYEKPISGTPQPSLTLPVPRRRGCSWRFAAACLSRVMYQHSYIGILFRYDPRSPRGFRLLLVLTVAFHTLFLTTLLYGYTTVGGAMTISESIVLSLITSALNIPFIRGLVAAMGVVGNAEYDARFPAFSHEYKRRQAFEAALRSTRTAEIEGVITRLKAGKTATCAIQTTPLSQKRRNSAKDGGDEFEAHAELGDSEDTAVTYVIFRIFRCLKRRAVSGGLPTALEIASTPDPYWVSPACDSLPVKTLGATGVVLACFGWIGWCMNYVLLFTAAQSTSTINGIAQSFGISQATSIALTQPLTILLTLLGTWAIARCRSRAKPGASTRHIGYFADPSFKNYSTTLSGAWAYWIFLYAGSASSLGLSDKRRSLGYSSSRVALAWLNNESLDEVPVERRDVVITTLYAYLRGLETPPTRRLEAQHAARQHITDALEEYKQMKFAIELGEVNDDVTSLVRKIEVDNKDAGTRVVSESARVGGTD